MGKLGKITRRAFLIGTAAIAGGVAFGYYKYNKPYPNPLKGDLAEAETTFNPYIKITADNKITIITPRAEMGQGVTTTLAALVAEELEVDLTSIDIEHGPAGWAYYNQAALEESVPFAVFNRSMLANSFRTSQKIASKFLGIQATGGSSSTVDAFDKMRTAGAAARAVMLKAAQTRLNAKLQNLSVKNGIIKDSTSGKSLTYGELAQEAAKITPPDDIKLKSPDEWKILGKSQPRKDLPAKVNGTAVFGIDIDLPDMVHATVRMSPRFGAKLKSYDEAKAKKMRGVEKIVDLGTGIGVLADNTWRAFEAAKAIDIKWHYGDYPLDTDGIFKKLETGFDQDGGWTMRDDGDTSGPTEISGQYKAPYLAHTCMEPMNATAQWKGGKLTLWVGTQAPTLLQMIGAREFEIDADAVTVHTTLLGGGFGRRFEIDFAVAAMHMAKHTNGRPVKVTWTREEDVTHDAYRPGAIARFKASLDKDGHPKTLTIDVATQPILGSLLKRTFPSVPAVGPDKTTIEGAFDQPYTIENYRVTAKPVELDIPVGFWRAVGNSYNGFFHEGIMDELATAGKTDPVKMRLKLMANYPTAIKVVEKVAAMSNWGEKLPKGKGRGFAFVLSFGAWVAQVIEVSDTPDGIKIDKVWCVADVGMALDPANIQAQLQSGIIFGLSAAIGQEITFKDGMVEQQNFDTYDAMRISQCPQIETAILQNSGRMSGIGEPGTPPAAPALANAIFNATGKRIRTLPLSSSINFI